MNQEPFNTALDELVEETARHIIWTVQPGAASDPLTAVKQLLFSFLEHVQEQQYQEALREHRNEEQAQQN